MKLISGILLVSAGVVIGAVGTSDATAAGAVGGPVY
jgi:hypothetical protein